MAKYTRHTYLKDWKLTSNHRPGRGKRFVQKTMAKNERREGKKIVALDGFIENANASEYRLQKLIVEAMYPPEESQFWMDWKTEENAGFHSSLEVENTWAWYKTHGGFQPRFGVLVDRLDERELDEILDIENQLWE